MGIAAHGTLFKAGDGGSPESFTTVAGVKNISGPGLSLDTADVTDHDSTNAWEELVGTILRSGEVTLEINYAPANATHDATTGLIAAMVARTIDNYQIVFPDTGTTTWTIPALVTGFEPGAPHDGSLSATVKLKVSGEPTLA